MTREEILDGIAKTDKVINNPIIPEAVKQVAINTKAKLQAQLDAMGGEAPKVEKEEVVEKVEVEKEVEKPAKKERVKFERKPRTPKAPKKEKEKETESPEAKAEKSMEGKKLSVANCRELLAKLKTRRESAKKRVATRKKQGKPAQLTTIEVLKKASDNLEKKVETEVNKDGKLQKTTIKRSTKEVVDIVATIISGIPTKAERTEYINEVIADLKKLIDKVEPITEKMEKGGYMADGGVVNTRELNKKIKDWYTKTYPTDEEGKEINDKITFKGFYGYLWQGYDVYDVLEVTDSVIRERVFEKLSEILGVDYDVVYKKWLQSVEYSKGGYMADGGINQNYEGLEIIIPSNYQNKNKLKRDIEEFIGDDYEDRGNKIFVRNKDVYGHGVTLSQLKDLYDYIDNNYGQIEVELFSKGGYMAKGGIFNRGPIEFKNSIQGSDGDYTYNLTFQPRTNLSSLYIDDNENGTSRIFPVIYYSVVEGFAHQFQDLMDEHEDEFTETNWKFNWRVMSAHHDDTEYGASSKNGVFTIFIGDKTYTFESESLMQEIAESFIQLENLVGDKGYDDQNYAKGGYMADGGQVRNYRTFVEEYPDNKIYVRVKFGGADKDVKTFTANEQNKKRAIDFAKTLAEKNNGTYEGFKTYTYAKGGSVMRNKNKNDWQSMFNFFVENNYQPIGKRDLINMAYESSNGIDSAIPQSMYGDVDNTAYYVYDYQTDKMGELVDLREKLKFSNVKVDVTIVEDDTLKYGKDLPSELQDVTFHQALNYVFNNDSIEQFAIRPKK